MFANIAAILKKKSNQNSLKTVILDRYSTKTKYPLADPYLSPYKSDYPHDKIYLDKVTMIWIEDE